MSADVPVGTRLRRWAALVTGNDRSVLLTYQGLRLGNILYLALHAHLQQTAGADFRVVDPAPADGWATAIPGLAGLLVHPGQVRHTDRRVHLPPSFLQGYGEDFTRAELSEFVRHRLLDVLGRPAPGEQAVDGDELLVNVRRGDYYSDPSFRAAYGFDVPDYVRRALVQAERASGPVVSVRVVSDDPTWCRAHLGFLAGGGRRVSWSAPTDGPLANLRAVARSRRLVIANSTFSYWGAYVSDVLHGDGGAHVWAPDLHSRSVRDGRPWQHDPRWHAVPVRAEGALTGS